MVVVGRCFSNATTGAADPAAVRCHTCHRLEDDVEVASDFQENFGVGNLLSAMLDVIYEGLGRSTVSICFMIVMSWPSSGRKFVSGAKL